MARPCFEEGRKRKKLKALTSYTLLGPAVTLLLLQFDFITIKFVASSVQLEGPTLMIAKIKLLKESQQSKVEVERGLN
jgi:hypothetical protein